MNDIVIIQKQQLKELLNEIFDNWLSNILSKIKPIPYDFMYFNTMEACILLKISKPTLIKYHKEKNFIYKRIGFRVLYSKKSLMAIYNT